eukprot:79899_1
MSTTEQHFQNVHWLPQLYEDQCVKYPKPLFYPLNSNSIIISTMSGDDKEGIFTYNINTNKLKLLCEYNFDRDEIEYHQHFIDYNNDILYIFDRWRTIKAFNLKTNKMTVMDICFGDLDLFRK